MPIACKIMTSKNYTLVILKLCFSFVKNDRFFSPKLSQE